MLYDYMHYALCTESSCSFVMTTDKLQTRARARAISRTPNLAASHDIRHGPLPFLHASRMSTPLFLRLAASPPRGDRERYTLYNHKLDPIRLLLL